MPLEGTGEEEEGEPVSSSVPSVLVLSSESAGTSSESAGMSLGFVDPSLETAGLGKLEAASPKALTRIPASLFVIGTPEG